MTNIEKVLFKTYAEARALLDSIEINGYIMQFDYEDYVQFIGIPEIIKSRKKIKYDELAWTPEYIEQIYKEREKMKTTIAYNKYDIANARIVRKRKYGLYMIKLNKKKKKS